MIRNRQSEGIMQNIDASLFIAGEILRALAVGALGVFAGAMLTEAGLLVPYWRSLGASAFYGWYRSNATRLVGFFGPITWLAGLSALAAAAVSLWTGHDGGAAGAGAAGLSLIVVSMFPIYFKNANASFVSSEKTTEDLRRELARWAAWHWVRTGVSIGAFVAAIMAVR